MLKNVLRTWLACGSLLALGCTEVPHEVDDKTPDAGAPDAGQTCTDLGIWQGTGFTATYWNNTTNTSSASLYLTLGNAARNPVLGVFGWLLTPTDVNTPVQLGRGSNAQWLSATHVLLVWIGCNDSTCDDGPYYSTSGTAEFTSIAQALNQPWDGAAVQVRFDKVAFDANNNMTIVPNSPCYTMDKFTFTANASIAGDTSGGSSNSSASAASESGANSTAAEYYIDAGH